MQLQNFSTHTLSTVGNIIVVYLTPLVMFLYQFQAPVVIAGTSFSLEYGRSIYGDIGKGTTVDYLIDFEMLTVEMIESYLERFLNLQWRLHHF